MVEDDAASEADDVDAPTQWKPSPMAKVQVSRIRIEPRVAGEQLSAPDKPPPRA